MCPFKISGFNNNFSRAVNVSKILRNDGFVAVGSDQQCPDPTNSASVLSRHVMIDHDGVVP